MGVSNFPFFLGGVGGLFWDPDMRDPVVLGQFSGGLLVFQRRSYAVPTVDDIKSA